jgi:hypothetical protein
VPERDRSPIDQQWIQNYCDEFLKVSARLGPGPCDGSSARWICLRRGRSGSGRGKIMDDIFWKGMILLTLLDIYRATSAQSFIGDAFDIVRNFLIIWFVLWLHKRKEVKG